MYTLTGPDVGESFSVAERKCSFFALSGALPVQLNKLVSYVDVFKVIIMKVPIFVQNNPVHKHIKKQLKTTKILMDILLQNREILLTALSSTKYMNNYSLLLYLVQTKQMWI